MTMSPKFLNFADVDKKLWRYRHEHGYIATEMLHLLPDGNVGGYDHPNERRWRIENGILSFLGQDGSTTVTFNDAVVRDGRLFLTGRCLPHPEVVLCLQEQGCRVRNNHTKDTLASEIETLGWSIGDHTYGIPTFFEKGLSRLVIGK